MSIRGILNFIQVNVGFGFDVPAKEAINYFKGKGLKESFSYVDVWKEEHAKAFTVAKMMDMDLLKDVQDSIYAALTEGLSYEQWSDRLIPTLQANGWWGRQAVKDPVTGQTVIAELGSARRLEIIFRTNMQSAYSVGRWQQIMQQADQAPYLMYDAVDDFRTRPLHRAWDNTVLRYDHVFWKTHYPPNGWGCRCGVIQLSDNDLTVMGLKVSDSPKISYANWQNPRTGINQKVPEGIDAGFDFNPGQVHYDNLKRLAKEKAQNMPAELVAPAKEALKKIEVEVKKPVTLDDTSSADKALTSKQFDQPPSETFSIYDVAAPKSKPDTSTPLRKAIVDFEDEIRDLDVEHGTFFGFGKDYKILSGVGDTNKISFDFTEDQLAIVKNSVFTHNHPGGGTFSVEDIVTASELELHEIRAVTSDLRHIMVFDKKWIDRKSLEKAIDEFIPKANDIVTAMLLSDEINRNNADDEVNHQVWRLVAQYFGFKYTRERS